MEKYMNMSEIHASLRDLMHPFLYEASICNFTEDLSAVVE
jgi:hypothetical protein